MLRVERVAKDEWRFIYPLRYDELMDKFGEGIELWQMDHTRAAEKIHKEIIAEFPGFIDVYNQLDLLYEESVYCLQYLKCGHSGVNLDTFV